MFGIDDAIIAAVIGGLAEALAGKGLDLLHGDPEKRAFKTALYEAMQELDRDHSEWTAQLFDEEFLTKKAAPILARAVMRSAEPAADELARAYADQFFAGEGHDTRVRQVTPVAAEFLLRLDLAMRRQPAFRAHFDSRAMDGTAVYLYQLWQQAKADWVDERSNWVTEALERLVGAASRYEDAGRMVAKGQAVDPEYLAKAREAVEQADLRLSRMGYTEGRRLRERLEELVQSRYFAIVNGPTPADKGAVALLSQGFKEFRELLGQAPPV